jgi:hypothetical protein
MAVMRQNRPRGGRAIANRGVDVAAGNAIAVADNHPAALSTLKLVTAGCFCKSFACVKLTAGQILPFEPQRGVC